MAINGRFAASMGDVFPHGAYVVADVEPVRDFDRSTRDQLVQAVDRETGLPVWSVTVLDADPDARKNDKTVTVKIVAQYQPVPPEAVGGMPFAAVEFEGLVVTPYLDDKGCKAAGPGERHRCRGRVAYSLRATGMQAPGRSGRAPSPTARSEGS
jgi:hypothetical protein